jgi:hypothetical protein
MKKTLLTLALVGLSAAASFAQGTIQFFNSALSKIKYVDAPGGVAVDAPAGVVVGVYWGTSADNLRLEPRPWTIVTPGLFGTSTATGVYPLTGTNPGETVSLQIRAWLVKGGATPAAADLGINTPGLTHYGQSAVVTTTALGPTAGPGTVVFQGASGTSINRAKPFEIVPVPEPSVIALGALGLGALLLRRRKA